MHVFTFPVAQTYHFLPWSLLIIMYFHPKFRTWLKENEICPVQLLDDDGQFTGVLVIRSGVSAVYPDVYPHVLTWLPITYCSGH
jgi:hypothetical protein